MHLLHLWGLLINNHWSIIPWWLPWWLSVRKQLTGGFLCTVLDLLFWILCSLLIREYSGISIRAWVPMSFFLSFSLSPPPSSSLFQFLIVDSGPPGSGPLKDHNTWSWHIFQCYNYQFIPLYQIFNFMVQLFFYNKSGNKNILTSGLQPKHHFMNEIYAILTPTR